MPKINKNSQPIGVFDSGVGGLSVFIELQKVLPNENFVFLADQEYVPYGEKSKKQLVQRCLKVAGYLIKEHRIKMLVVACNTATCAAIDEMRKKYKFPIVGTVPAVKAAAQKTKTKSIAVISTPSTSQSTVLKRIIKENCAGIKVSNIGCPNLEDAVEKGKLNSLEVQKLLLKYLNKVKNSKADCVVLGCTHYPFLRAPIRKFIGRKIKLIDGGAGIAKRSKNLLQKNSLKNGSRAKGKTLFLTTSDPLRFQKVAGKLLKYKVMASQASL